MKVNGVPIVVNPQVVSASYSDGTIVTGTLAETVSRSLLIPANTFTSGILETVYRCSKTGIAGALTIKMYKNTSNTLVGATLLATFETTPATSLYTSGMRNLRISSNTMTGMSPLQTGEIDYTRSSSAVSSTTFTTSVDNYILITLTLGSTVDSANVNMLRLTKYE